ncbi:DUF4166 domain-containing protein [Fulvimarina sp. 2208YS6-2-32]|uniref:DUF4166 domain-containing protein n=1 Tax=Fulvimarina uroteuthidis TaxID=3098149 RepID=A0ABU5I3P5_9HYPH|nr:DUF4166 domain-containing protein [Fulvimarina sp. 2208YS6-2-32]MDY8109994.1 DUF4166 domain-containing protein [Fulvimarina sp. 2208YS6-2-32]
MRVMILGGYGAFGGRLARLLADCPDLELLICGRSFASAEAFCRDFKGAARTVPVELDRDTIAKGLSAFRPDLVVDASGPFQDYGADGYAVVKAAIRHGANYLDFADGADFVAGIARYDKDAKAAGLFALSGVSTFPVLTAAVLREIAKTIAIREVRGGMAPSPHAGLGVNVIGVVLGYAGGPVAIRRGGETRTAYGLTESLDATIAPPGALPLRSTRFSLVEVPDLTLVPLEHETLRDIWIGAGPGPQWAHRVLNLFAKVRRRFGLPSLKPLAPLVHWILERLASGEHRGGMFIEATGPDGTGTERTLTWHLIAEGDDGPLIPSMAIEAIVRKLRCGERPAPGARAAVRALELSDYLALFEDRRIVTGFRETPCADAPVFRKILGPGLDVLPAAVRAFHDSAQPRRWSGFADIVRGTSLLSRLVGAIIRVPPAGMGVPLDVTVTPDATGESWVRQFGHHRLTSVLTPGIGRHEHLMCERFGWVDVGIALVIEHDRLRFVPRHWAVLGIPMPKRLLPSAKTFETAENGRFRFDVIFSAPIVGLIATYRGWLEPAAIGVPAETGARALQPGE